MGVTRCILVVAALAVALLVPAAATPDPPALQVTGATVEATGPDGAQATYKVKAVDPTTKDDLPATCDTPAGTAGVGSFSVTAQFSLGTTSVTCDTVTTEGTPVSDSASVVVQDTTPPQVSVPADISTSSEDPSGKTVTYDNATANDVVDGSLTPSCAPGSGSKFGPGTTTVTCSATDAHGNTGQGSFSVTVTTVDTTPPVLTVPSGVSASTGNPGGTVVTYSASATDNVDGQVTVSCAPGSGSTFPVGTTKVDCSASDSHGNSASASFNVVVTLVDNTPPVLSVPGGVSVNTTNPGGTVVTYSASANDNLDGPVPVSCSPTSGGTFPVGTTPVNCSATDSHGNSNSASFNVVVTLVDNTPPVVSVPGGVSANTTSPSGTVVTYSASATDNIDGPVPVSCAPGSGSTFPVGTTKVTCTATDAHGNSKSASFNVVVTLVDTTPPVVTVPDDMTVETPNPAGAPVTYTASASDNLDGPLPANCAPASGSTFPVGTTQVTCSAQDAHGNSSQKTFKVTVVLVDTSAPVLSNVPAAIRREADNSKGAIVVYVAPTAVDNVDGPLPASCTPKSGTAFALGTTTVTCSATDAHGNTATASFTVTVLDKTPPRLVVPPDATANATTDTGIPATEPVIAAFLAAASATDTVDASPKITSDAPATFPVGTTVVTFTATDESGNSSRGTAKMTVRPKPPAGTPQVPPVQVDRTPPGDVTLLKAKGGNRIVRVTWSNPKASDFDHVELTRSGSTPDSPGTVVYRGAGTSFADRSVQNNVEYRYLAVALDRTGNASRGVAVAATPARLLLVAPPDGAKLRKAPLLDWEGSSSARYYNVQVYDGAEKVLSAWPNATKLALKRSWKYKGKNQRLKRGRMYRWYVWPGLGARKDARYGQLLGSSTFQIVA
jgi:HYR domain-containing protein